MGTNFSSLTVTYNDSAHLEESLGSLNFCEEKIVVDLGSSDNCPEISRQAGAKVYQFPRKDIVEEIKADIINLPKNDWIIFCDPDEIFPSGEIGKIVRLVEKYNDLGAISILVQNYFLGRKIKYGRWRPYFHNSRIIFRPGVVFTGLIHKGMSFKDGYQTISLPEAIIKHYWIDSMDEFFEKHNRYLKYEGQSRYQRGYRY